MSDYTAVFVVLAAGAFLLWIIFAAIPRLIGLYGGCHPAPEIPYSPEEAHAVWLRRIDCDRHTCDAKRAALRVLEANHLVRLAGNPR